MGRTSATSSLIAEVRAVLGRHVPAGAVVVVGVSGGPDSVALLTLAAAARPDLRLVVGHVRHGLRDDAPDVAAVRAAAGRLGVDLAERSVEVGGGAGPEDAARRARLAALREVAVAAGTDILLLGHTGDDQAETLLLRLARGTGPDGMGGMREVVDLDGLRVVRPMLGLRRADVRSVVADLPTATDPSNTDPDQRRARARQHVLPLLGTLRPDDGDPVPALMRLARLAGAQQRLADRLVGSVQRVGMAVVVPDPASPASPEDPEIVSSWRARLLRKGWDALPGRPARPAAATLARVLDLAHGEQADVAGGVRVDRTETGWVLRSQTNLRLPHLAVELGRPLALPGHAGSWTVWSTASGPTPHDHAGSTSAWTVAASPEAVDSLVVRGRAAAGDRAARAALARWPRPLRDQVPLLCDGRGVVLLAGDVVVSPPRPGAVELVVTGTPITPSPRYPVAP